jgi:hypothetical protein
MKDIIYQNLKLHVEYLIKIVPYMININIYGVMDVNWGMYWRIINNA